jgi:predicted membrane channel-forming protein YqfA (hemolysin III family)
MRPARTPYRGEYRPKLFGHPYVPDPSARKLRIRLWIILAIVGIALVALAIYEVLVYQVYRAACGVIIYAMGIGIMALAIRDAKKIETLTPSDDNVDQENLAKVNRNN